MNTAELYENYKQQIGNRQSLYCVVTNAFNITRALYPGSHIDIAPSLVIPDVTYIDNFKGAISFFNDLEGINQYVFEHKEYSTDSSITFYANDYTTPLEIKPVDLIISQFAGFVGQATKHYLKPGGILLCNDSHGDATLAYLDNDYELIGIIDSSNHIKTTSLDTYFTFARPREIDIKTVTKKMKGPKYKNMPSNYLFRLKK